MIAAAGSDSGKTVLTLALLRALRKRGLEPAAFKCGPDYIDPMFLSEAAGQAARNLDVFMCGENTTKYLLAQNAKKSGFSVIEGVMGLYDGIATSDNCSSNHLSMLTETPVVLCVNPKGMSLSLAAQIKGIFTFRPNRIKAVILNRVSEKMAAFYSKMLEAELGINVYGFLPETKLCIGSRHLGLVAPSEIDSLDARLEEAASLLENSVDIDGLLRLGKSAPVLTYEEPVIPLPQKPVRIAIARDAAFSFYYEDNFDLLRRLGAELVFFSPLADKNLPEGISGLILGGGYPELYTEELQKNRSMLESVRRAVTGGLPTLAECGGYVYLCKNFAGVLDSEVRMTERLTRFGYISLEAEKDNMLCLKGDSIKAHEFHYSDSTDNGSAFTARKADGRSWPAIHATETLFAGYPHLHLWGNIRFAQNFILRCGQA